MDSRYSRQMLVHGADTQAAIGTASVLVVGCGGLGCGCLPYLVGAGIGRVTVCDGDVVDVTNLHRQVLYSEADAGTPKAIAAVARLRALNSTIAIRAVARPVRFDHETLSLVFAHDIVVDCSDNIGTRYLLNDTCFLARKPLIAAAALGVEGTLARWGKTGGSGCYRCVHPRPVTHEARRSCADRGVLGPVPGALGALQALDVIRYVSGDVDAAPVRIFDGTSLRSFLPPPRNPPRGHKPRQYATLSKILSRDQVRP